MTDSVAIVGMACRYPDANSPGELWENVLAQRQSFRRIPPERLRLEDYLATERNAPDSTYSSEAALLDGFEFDRQRYRVAGSLYRTVDPAHWLALDVATEALGDAGYDDRQQLPRDMTGVIVGNTLTGDFSRSNLMRLRWPFVRRMVETELMKEDWPHERRHSFLGQLGQAYKAPFPPIGEESLAGGLSNTIAGRICNYYDLHGGGYIVDGACASSLIAVSTACSLLVARDLDVVLAGGVDLSIDPFELVGFAKAGALASGKMRVYDERSEGFLPGEGCGFVVLMRHRDAVAEGRRIYAVICGWGISSDGHGGMTRPEVDGQCMAIERAYRRAGFSPKTVGYFEGHGTGTSVGDQTELSALTRALSKRKGAATRAVAGIGSVKANIGHTKAAAGVAGLIKAAMAVHTQLLPPTSGCEEPHPTLKADVPVLRVLKEGELWPANSKLRAGINALGFGGINAHLVLEGYGNVRRAKLTGREKSLLASAQDAEIFLLSAASATELLQQIERLSGFAAKISRAELTDLAATLEDKLQPSTIRAALVAATPAQLAHRLKKLQALLENNQSAHLDVKNGIFLGTGSLSPRIGFLFPGQGAPLHLDGGAFKRCFEFVGELYEKAAHPVEADGTGVAQPAILRASLAGIHTMNALGIRADIAVGHSLGELAALCWAGALSEEALLRIGEVRGSAMMEVQKPSGAMVSINASSQKVQHLLNGDPVVIAGLNAPHNTVVAGEAQALASFVERVKADGITAIMLPVSHAFHSPLMESSVTKIARHLESESFGEVRRAVVSTVTGDFIEPDEDLRQLLLRQITAPVRFMEAIGRASSNLDLLIEVGPGRILGGLVKDFLNTPVVSLDAGGESVIGLLQSIGAAFALGAQINHHAIFEKRFTRPFNLDWQPRFIVNPCELAPIPEAFVPDAEVRAVALDERLLVEEKHHSGNGGEPAAGLIGESPLELFRRLVAERIELSPADVRDDDRLLSDLHLNSIAVSQLVTEAAKQLGLPALASPTEYSTFTVAEVARALDELLGMGVAAFEAQEQAAGVDTWIRQFTVELIEKPLQRRHVERQAGEWRVLCASDCRLKDALHRALTEAEIGDGICVVLPENDEAARLSLLLNGAQAAIAEKRPTKFVLVNQGGSGAAFVRTLHLESPGTTTCVITLPVAHPRAVEWIIAEAGEATGYVEVDYDESGTRREPVLKLSPPSGKPSEVLLGAEDVIVVSGGGKGIAAECAISLAAQTGGRLILLGRSLPSEDEELAGNLARMTALNIKYSYESVDITNQERVGSILRRVEKKFGPITAFVHGAGANVPQLIPSLDEASVRRTLAPKIQGARNILAAIDPARLRLFISFSSLIARTGMRGEADYALANEMLTEMTEDWRARHPHCKCLSVEWSIWSGVGMGERLGRVDALMRQGITPISPDEGLRVFDDLVGSEQQSVAVVVAGRFGEMPTLKSEQVDLPFQRFLEKTLVNVSGVELIVEFEATTDSDPYLKDHVYQGDPLFPSVMGLEAMAQVSMALMETEGLPVFENVKFSRPVVVPEKSSTQVRIAALKRASDRVDVVIRCSNSGFHIDHFSATCRFAPGEAASDVQRIPADSIKVERACASLIPDRNLYGEILFQSGRFQRLQGYRNLRARECVAEIRRVESTDWFSSYLPTGLMLGDPAVRDAALHAIQACIPHQTILPVEVERIVVSSIRRSPAIVLLRASEQSHEGKRFTYNLEIADEEGMVLERWQGLQLYQIEAISLTNYTWVEPLLGTYVERRLEELLAGAGVAVVFERDGASECRARSDRAIARCGGAEKIHRRTDGRPVVAGELTVSASHAEELTMAIAGHGSLGCDVERAVAHSPSFWRELLGGQRYELARLIAVEGSEDEAAAATRVWTACESLKKAGANVGVPVMLHSITDDGWVQLQSGELRIATYIAKLAGVDERLVMAVCGEGANMSAAN